MLPKKLFKGDKYEKLSTKEIELSDKNADTMESGQLLEKEKPKEEKKELPKSSMTMYELMTVLSPYFWPKSGSDGAFINRIRSTSTWLMITLSKVCNIMAPWMIANATNDLLAGQYIPALHNMIIYILLRFLSSTFKEMQSLLYIKVKQQASIELQELTFRHLHTLSLHWHLSKKTGSIMKSMDRGVEAANQLITYLFLFLMPAIMECIAVGILFFIQYKQYQLGLIVYLGVISYAFVTIFITQWRKKFREQTNKHDNDFHDKATDSIINYETVKYFTNETYEIDQFTKSVIKYQQSNSSTQYSLSFLNVSQQLILNLTLFGTMVISAQAVIHGNMTIGGWIAVQSWVTTVFVPLNFLGSVYAAIFQAFIDIKNLTELLSQSPDVVDKPDAKELIPYSSSSYASSYGASVEFRNVYFHYPEQPEEKGLKGVNFYVRPGSTTAIVGHTGAGKTTISRLLFRFYDPLEGHVLINGEDIQKCTQKSVRHAIGIVPQDTVLFNDTIYHNIAYGKLGASKEEVFKVAEAAQILSFIESLPEKWETMVGERGLKLSGGEKQRVAIARCLLKNPPVVLLDEATSALDTITENSIQMALQALGQNRTVIVIAHRLSTIKQADQIIVMDKGRVVELGTHQELLQKPQGSYAQLWNMQIMSNNKPLENDVTNNNDNLFETPFENHSIMKNPMSVTV